MKTLEKIQEISKLLEYDSGTGDLRWSVFIGGNSRKGSIAGSLNKRGYRVVGYRGRHFYAHRIIWTKIYGSLPELIDHKDGNPTNNRIDNLRSVTNSQNLHNTKNHRLGVLPGTYFRNDRKRWISAFKKNGKNTYLGSFFTREEAYHRYLKELDIGTRSIAEASCSAQISGA